MYTRSALLFALITLHVCVAAGSQIASKQLAQVADESSVVVVGVVERIDRVSSSKTDGERFVAHVRVVSSLRGPTINTGFKLLLHVGGIRGFDTQLSEGDQAVFFLRSIESGEAKLQTWGSIALIPSGYFHLD